MLSQKEILKTLSENMDTFRKYGVKKIGLFGSYVRNDQTDKSDIDLVVEFEAGKKTFDNYMELKFELVDLFKKDIDLVILESIKPDLKQIILGSVKIESLPYNESKLKEELITNITNNQEMIDVLRQVRKLNLPDWYVAAGFIRNYIWDFKHGYNERTSLNDIDVIYYDPSDIKEEIEKEYEKRLREINPLLPWSVKNQARMHTVKNHHPYKSVEEAMIHWPETATAVGIRLNNDDSLSVIAPFGLHDLFNLILRRSPEFTDKEYFRKRYQEKNWLQKWPQVRVIDDEIL